MKKQGNTIWVMAITLIFCVITAFGGIEKDIPLNEVPDVVLKAAQKAVPGIKLTEAEVETTPDGVIYELEGKFDGKEYEIKYFNHIYNLLVVVKLCKNYSSNLKLTQD